MYLLILPAVSKNIIDKGRKSICVTVSLRTYMYSQLIYLQFGGSYTSFTQLELRYMLWNTSVHQILVRFLYSF